MQYDQPQMHRGYFTVLRRSAHAYEDGLWVPIMHYAKDGRPGQCCTVHERDLQANIDANLRDGYHSWPENSPPPYIALRRAA